jgi:hypothetical protein
MKSNNTKKVKPPAPLTKPAQEAARLPTFKDTKLVIKNEEQLEYLDSILKTKYDGASLAIIEQALGGNFPRSETDSGRNTTLQQLDELKPQSYLEAMLISQMIQVSNAAGNCMNRAFHKDQTFAGKELNANLAIKFHRTFVAQIEALQKLRGKGGQKVTVEHVHVHEGGQAIVGNVNHGTEGGRGENGN